MKLDYNLFNRIAEKAKVSPRLRKNYDLRDSAEEQSQRMLNVLLQGSHVNTHRHSETSEIVICVQGSVVERFHDENGNVTKEFTLKAGSECSSLWIPVGQYHSLDCYCPQAAIIEFKTGKYAPIKTEEFLDK